MSCGWPISVKVSGLIKKIKQRVKKNQGCTLRGMAWELGTNEKSVRKSVKLSGAHSLAWAKRFLLTNPLGASRMAKGKKILSIL